MAEPFQTQNNRSMSPNYGNRSDANKSRRSSSPNKISFVGSAMESPHEHPAVRNHVPKKPKIRLNHRNAYFDNYNHVLLLREHLFYASLAAIACLFIYGFFYKHTDIESTTYTCVQSTKCVYVLGFLLAAIICATYYARDRLTWVCVNRNQDKLALLGLANHTVFRQAAKPAQNESSCQTQFVNCFCVTCQRIGTRTPENKYKAISNARSRETSAPTTLTTGNSLKGSTKSPTSNTSTDSSLMNTSAVNTSMTLIYNTSAKEHFINDKENLRDFLRSVRYNDSELKPEDPRNKLVFETPVYQLAPSSEIQPTLPEHDSNSITKVERESHLLMDIKQEQLVQYLANLRRWLSKTIIERLCQEFDKTNEIFRNNLNSDEKIGVTSIERLRKMSLDKEFVNRIMPNLPLLYRFLNLCPNQAYLVQRIRELATGTCLAEYSWKNFNMRLPSDAAILFHLFCVYMDSQLNPMPQGCSERPFHGQYVIIEDGKRSPKELISSLKNRAQCAIVCSGFYSPKFRFICNGEIQSSATGANNLFHVILYFLLYLRANNITSLEGVSLGKQGINIACIIED